MPSASSIFPIASLLIFATSLAGQSIAMDAGSFALTAEHCEFGRHLDRDAMFLRQGSATVAELDFEYGTIEFDIAFGDARGFVGAKFHIDDAFNYEHFYLRPHQSGNPDASQYQPVVNGHAAWQLCYGERYANPRKHSFDSWQHVRLVVAPDGADVFVDDTEPLLQVRPLLRAKPGGGVALTASHAPAWFANLRIDTKTPPMLTDEQRPIGPAPDGMITTWLVSEAFDEERLADDDPTGPLGTTWSPVSATIRGIANLAEVATPGGPNTVVARTTITSEEERRVALDFGFSDRAAVYLDGQLLYRGTRNYAGPDYRFLGTVGLHDTVILPLTAGRHVLAIAVTEDFGGWGLTARLHPTPGVHVEGGM